MDLRSSSIDRGSTGPEGGEGGGGGDNLRCLGLGFGLGFLMRAKDNFHHTYIYLRLVTTCTYT